MSIVVNLINWNIWPLTWCDKSYRHFHVGPLFVRYHTTGYYTGWWPR